jgi:hypothetical protein
VRIVLLKSERFRETTGGTVKGVLLTLVVGAAMAATVGAARASSSDTLYGCTFVGRHVPASIALAGTNLHHMGSDCLKLRASAGNQYRYYPGIHRAPSGQSAKACQFVKRTGVEVAMIYARPDAVRLVRRYLCKTSILPGSGWVRA